MGFKKNLSEFIGYGKALQIKYFFQKPTPKEIIIDICAACNAKCPFCPRVYMPEERSKGFMDIDLYIHTLDEASKNDIHRLRLYSTAEPTLHPKFDEMIQIAKEKGFYIAISTNASFLDKHIDSLMNVDLLQYSIEGWNKESYEIYRHPLSFDKVYANIAKFHAASVASESSPIITTNLLLTKETDVNTYLNLWGPFVDHINVHYMLEAVLYDNDKFISKRSDQLLNEYYDFEPQNKNFFCAYPFTVLTVAFDGKIALCCNDFSAQLDLGNITDGIQKVYSSNAINTIRKEFYSQQLDTCKGCAIFKYPTLNAQQHVNNKLSTLDSSYKEKLVLHV